MAIKQRNQTKTKTKYNQSKKKYEYYFKIWQRGDFFYSGAIYKHIITVYRLQVSFATNLRYANASPLLSEGVTVCFDD